MLAFDPNLTVTAGRMNEKLPGSPVAVPHSPFSPKTTRLRLSLDRL